jgi:hypothetical protein
MMVASRGSIRTGRARDTRVRAHTPVRAIASRPVNWARTLQAVVHRPGDEGEGPPTSLANVVMWALAAAYA